MKNAREVASGQRSIREVDDLVRGEIRRIACVASDSGEALKSIGAQLVVAADEVVPDLAMHDLDGKAHALRSTADYASKVIGDVQRLAGRLETLAGVRRALEAAEL